jgi:hypothetical protein
VARTRRRARAKVCSVAMARPSVIIKRERARKINLIARYDPDLARQVERRELSPDKAIKQVAADMVRERGKINAARKGTEAVSLSQRAAA